MARSCWNRRARSLSLSWLGLACVALATTGCYDKNFFLEIGGRGTGYVFNALDGTYGLGGPLPALLSPSRTIRAGRWQTFFTTTFGIGITFPEGRLQLSGTFVADTAAPPASAAGVAATGERPRKILVRIEHLSDTDEVLGSFRMVLKVSGDSILQSSRAFPGFALTSGQKVRVSFKPKGGSLTPGERIELQTYFLRDFGSLAVAAVRRVLGLGDSAPAGITVPAVERRGILTLTDTVFGIACLFGAGPVEVGGNFFAADRSGLARKIKVKMEHLDGAGDPVRTFRMGLPVNDGTIPTVKRRFPGFDVGRGDRVRANVIPRRGSIDFSKFDYFQMGVALGVMTDY